MVEKSHSMESAWNLAFDNHYKSKQVSAYGKNLSQHVSEEYSWCLAGVCRRPLGLAFSV